MAQVIPIPIRTSKDGLKWLDLEPVLGKRVVLRAHEIDLKNNVLDYDSHHVLEAHAKGDVRIKSKCIEISEKILTY
ncbi:MAG: hypothetical protein WC979_10145 [Candidatus Pacearchaeota archaeon]|jgi:hypothetical protein